MVTRRIAVGSSVELAVLEWGVGGRPLLVLHGFTGAKEDVADHGPALAARGWHVVAPDLRGHGASSAPSDEDAYSFASLTDDALGLADALGWERFVLMGHSMGGMVAQLVALQHPQRVRALVLADTHHGPLGGLPPDVVAQGVQLVRAGGIDAYKAILAGFDGLELATVAASPSLLVRSQREGFEAYCEAKVAAASPAMICAMVPAMLAVEDRAPALVALRLPTLVLAGEADGFLGASWRLADAIPGACLVVLAEGGHSPHFEVPDAWWEAVSGFLDTLPAS